MSDVPLRRYIFPPLPPVSMVLLMLVMWYFRNTGIEFLALPQWLSAFFWVPVAFAVIILGWAKWEFHRWQTTVNPLGQPTALATTGIYRFSRNPMYLGMALLLLAWAMYLSNALMFTAIPVFVFYINRIYIKREEATLTQLIGKPFIEYMQRVRRWL